MIIAFTDDKSPTAPQKSFNSSVTPTILNDTSLAAALLTNGDRHLFFQGAEGSLRRVIHTAATSQWILDDTPIVTSDARHLTPMAVHTQGAPEALQVGIEHDSEHDNNNVINSDYTLLHIYQKPAQ